MDSKDTVKKDASNDRVHCWPYLTRLELIATIWCTIVLILWSLLLNAPIEEAANPSKTPNPAKAPWYFLGLQEMLVYFDPWIAGVVLPTLIIIGLMAIPYIDVNPKGNGYYTYKERMNAINVFFFGFYVLWVLLIVLGVFFRGPGWNIFWPWQEWDLHKVVALTNVDLPYKVGIRSYWGGAFFGATLIAAYYFLGVIYYFIRKEHYKNLGVVRYSVKAFLFLSMFSLPIKMFLRLAFNIKYILVTPWFNI